MKQNRNWELLCKTVRLRVNVILPDAYRSCVQGYLVTQIDLHNAFCGALRKLSRAEVSADRENIQTKLAIHEISENVSARHFDQAFIENIIGHHISEDQGFQEGEAQDPLPSYPRP